MRELQTVLSHCTENYKLKIRNNAERRENGDKILEISRRWPTVLKDQQIEKEQRGRNLKKGQISRRL